MLHTLIRHGDGRIETPTDLAYLAGFLADPACLVWVAVEAEPRETLESLAALFQLHPITLDDLINRNQRPKIEEFDEYVFLVIHALCTVHDDELDTEEIDIALRKNAVLTVHARPLEHLQRVFDRAVKDPRILQNGPSFLVYLLSDAVVDGYFPVLEALEDEIDALEDAVVEAPARARMRRVFEVKRVLVQLRKVVSPQREVYNALSRRDYSYIEARTAVYFRDIHDHLVRAFEMIDSYRDLVANTLDAYLAATSNRLGQVMKQLTVIATIFMPLSFFDRLLRHEFHPHPLPEPLASRTDAGRNGHGADPDAHRVPAPGLAHRQPAHHLLDPPPRMAIPPPFGAVSTCQQVDSSNSADGHPANRRTKSRSSVTPRPGRSGISRYPSRMANRSRVTPSRNGWGDRSYSKSGSAGNRRSGKVRERRKELQRGRQPNAGPPHVRDDRQIGRAGHGDDLLHLAEAATGAEIRLENVHRSAVDQLSEAVPGVLALAPRNEHRCVSLYLQVPVQILGRDRLLEPVHVVGLHGPGQADRLRRVVGVVGIHHQEQVGADRLPDGPDVRQVGSEVVAHLELHAAEARLLVAQRLLHQRSRNARHALRLVQAGGVHPRLVPIRSAEQACTPERPAPVP